MKIRYILSLLTVAFLLGSCATPKVAYFTDLKRGTAEHRPCGGTMSAGAWRSCGKPV